MAEYDWMQKAACLGLIDEMWDDSTPTNDALRVCFRCDVRTECAQYGLARPPASDAGVLGALGLYDRDRIREGKKDINQVWQFRMNKLLNADWDDAMAEDYARLMPRLALV